MRTIGSLLLLLALTATAAQKKPVACADWRPAVVKCAFPGDVVEERARWHFDEQVCGQPPKGFGTSGWVDPKDASKAWDSHVYVSNLDAASAPNALLFDWDDDPTVDAKRSHGYYHVYFPRTVTNGWAFLAFDFKTEKGEINLELRGPVVGDREVKKGAKVNDLSIAGYPSIGDKFSVRLYGGGGGSVGPVQRHRWQRINLWLPTQTGTSEGVQSNGWMRLDELALDGSVAAKGTPKDFRFDPLFMVGPWTCLSIVGKGPTRYMIDNIVYGRVK